MTRRKYTIEAATRTLALFLRIADEVGGIAGSLVVRVSTNSTEEYHYIVLLADEEVHKALRGKGYHSKVVL